MRLSGVLALYLAVLAAALVAGRRMDGGWQRTLVLVSPAAPFLLGVWVVARMLRQVDEYVRSSTLGYLALAAAVTAGWTFAYGFLENAGFPRLSMFTVWPVMGLTWGLAAAVDRLRAR